MRTPAARAELARENLPCATCLTDAEWTVVSPLLPCPAATGHPPHHGEIGGRDRSRQVINAASADPERLDLPGDGKVVPAIDHRFAPRCPALPSALDKKSLVDVNSPILACGVFTAMAGAVSGPGRGSEHRGSSFEKLSPPSGDRVGVDFEVLG